MLLANLIPDWNWKVCGIIYVIDDIPALKDETSNFIGANTSGWILLPRRLWLEIHGRVLRPGWARYLQLNHASQVIFLTLSFPLTTLEAYPTEIGIYRKKFFHSSLPFADSNMLIHERYGDWPRFPRPDHFLIEAFAPAWILVIGLLRSRRLKFESNCIRFTELDPNSVMGRITAFRQHDTLANFTDHLKLSLGPLWYFWPLHKE